MIRFYVLREWSRTKPVEAGPDLTLTLWRPHPSSLRPPGCRGPVWIIWRLFHSLGVFANNGYAVGLVHEGGILVHRALVTPGYFRFPFMAAGDLQIGDTWTAPTHRGRGIATWALGTIATAVITSEKAIWYVADEANARSCRVAERAGFRLAGRGERAKRFGSGLLGQYRISESG
jgi:RimJ/RimL family protein N-acetyltransferase